MLKRGSKVVVKHGHVCGVDLDGEIVGREPVKGKWLVRVEGLDIYIEIERLIEIVDSQSRS